MPLSAGSVVLSVQASATVLLPKEKGRRLCSLADKCGLGQLAQWEAHHRKICKKFNQYDASAAYQALPAHEKLDGLLLSHLTASLFCSANETDRDGPLSLLIEGQPTPFSTFSSLLAGPSQVETPAICPMGAKNVLIDGVLEELYARFGNNNFTIHSHLVSVAHGIFSLASRLFNHSCVPNAAAKYIFTEGEPPRMEIFALREIGQGEEICIPYLDPALYQTRQQIFSLTYGFTCTCPSCIFVSEVGSISEPPKEDTERRKLEKSLRDFVFPDLDRQPSSLTLPLGWFQSVPAELLPALHESFLGSLTETFSAASHDGPYSRALDVGITILAVYCLIYPPNYPQIGVHMAEMSKTAWNATVRGDAIDGLEEKLRAYIDCSLSVLNIMGTEGDQEDGPLEDIRVIRVRVLSALYPNHCIDDAQRCIFFASTSSTKPQAMGSTTPKRSLARGNGGIIPMRVTTLLALGISLSLFFIMAISFAFLGEEGDEPYFKSVLTDVAQNSPGIVLLGESVDVDVDEPSITVRWSIHGCGDEFVLPNSSGIGGSPACGLPATALRIFVDNNVAPSIDYDPTQLPFVLSTGQRRNVQNLVQFDSDHILDVHEARLYPFDTYLLTATLHAVNALNESVPIQKVVTIDQTSNFLVATADLASYNTLANGTQVPTRDVDMRVKRPGQARTFTLLLFTISWMLTHMTMGLVFIIWSSEQSTLTVLKFLALSFGALLAIPQFRNAMPDAPGFDGFLIDYIGFFAQMIFTGLSILVLLVMLISREFHLGPHRDEIPLDTRALTSPPLSPSPSVSRGYHKLPRTPDTTSWGRSTASIHMGTKDLSMLIKHLNGEFTFPGGPPPPTQTSQMHYRNRSSRYESPHSSWTGQSERKFL
ncbi:hypothetical protein HWV62_41651 [Athelia sp. TMB]|nr:hypothetical protein HWV62_41651 [Athelia sp. TMB]